MVPRKTLQEKVAEFHKIHLRDIFVVNTSLDGCDIEICFFIVQRDKPEDKTQLVFTYNYFNPKATENLVLKLAEAEANHAFIEFVGFVGKFSDDDGTLVDEGVDIGFENFITRIEEMARNLRRVEDIESFISIPVELMQRKGGPIPIIKHVSERSSRTRPKFSMVDLTAVEEKDKGAYILTDDVSPSFFIEYACSEILEKLFSDDFYDADSKCLIDGWDQQVNQELFTRPPFDQERFDKWITDLKYCELYEYFEDGFLDVTKSSRTPPPATPLLIPDEECQSIASSEPEVETQDFLAPKCNEQKAPGSSRNQRKPIPITKPLGCRLDPGGSVDDEFKPRKLEGNLLKESEMEAHKAKKNASLESRTSLLPSLSKSSQRQFRPRPFPASLQAKHDSISTRVRARTLRFIENMQLPLASDSSCSPTASKISKKPVDAEKN